MPALVWICDADGRNIHSNDRWYAYTGQTEAEASGDGWQAMLHPDDATRILPYWNHCLRTGETYEGEARYRRHDGAFRWFTFRAVPRRDAAGQIAGWYGVSLDIDERKRLEREIAERAAQLETIFEAMTDGVIIARPDGSIQMSNQAYRTLLGLGATDTWLDESEEVRHRRAQPRDAAGRSMPPERWPLTRILSGETIAAEPVEDVFIRTVDGREIAVNGTGAPLRDAAERVIGGVLVVRDVTDRRRLDQRTRETLEALVAITQTLVETPDETGDIARSGQADLQTAQSSDDAPLAPASGHHDPSPLARRLTELTRSILRCSRAAVTAVEEVDGRLYDWPVAIAGMSPEQERVWWDEQLAARPREVGLGLLPEDRARLLAGEVLILDLTRPPYQPPNTYGISTLLWTAMRIQGRIAGLLALDFADPGGQPHVFTQEEIQIAAAVARLGAVVLERERLLRERAQAQARELAAVEANRRMDEFLGIASHELRTPLTSARANLQLAARRIARVLDALAAATGADAVAARNQLEPLPPLLARGEGALDRLGRLVNDLLDTSRIQAGKLSLRTERVDLRALVREAMDEALQLWPIRVVRAEGALGPRHPSDTGAPEAGVWVEADPDRLRQVVLNYLTNALKYAPPERPITVGLEARANVARVAVRDQGPGLTPAQQEHLFERFYRVGGINHQEGSGIGLGLGLFICREIVVLHGGRVGVESAPGLGSTFWFEVPLSGDAREQAPG